MASMTLPALPEESFHRILCVVAHPDDMEYGTSAAVARWTARGIEVGYLLLTRGEAGMPNPPEETARLRVAEQRAACATVGIRHLTVLEHPDGVLVYGLDLRRDICREIRLVQGRRPTRRWLRDRDALWLRPGGSSCGRARDSRRGARRRQPVGLPGAGRRRGPRTALRALVHRSWARRLRRDPRRRGHRGAAAPRRR